MFFTVPLMAAVQYISGKIGLVTGLGLTGVLKKHYSRRVLYPVLIGLVIANTINAGSDLGAIAAALNLLLPVPAVYLVPPVAVAILVLQGWGTYRLIERIFKWLTLALVAFIGAGFLARPDWREVAWNTFVPHLELSRASLEALVALLGTTFAPYLYFWQSDQEVEEKMALGRRTPWRRRGTTDAELKCAAWDINLGMIASNLVTYFTILTAAATLNHSPDMNLHNVQSAQEAAQALQPIAGRAAGVLLALGLIGGGLLAVPVLTTSAGYAFSEAFGWKYGLDRKPWQAPRFYLVIGASTLIGVFINYVGINPITALVMTSTIYGFLAPPLLLLLMLVSNNRTIMGKRKNGWLLNILGWTATAACFAGLVGLVWTWFLSG